MFSDDGWIDGSINRHSGLNKSYLRPKDNDLASVKLCHSCKCLPRFSRNRNDEGDK